MHAHTADSAVCLHAHMHCVIGTATTVHPGPLSLSLATFKDVRGTESLELNIFLRPCTSMVHASISLPPIQQGHVLHMDLMHASWLP
jgi:hypothetical protein